MPIQIGYLGAKTLQGFGHRWLHMMHSTVTQMEVVFDRSLHGTVNFEQDRALEN